MKIFNLVVAVFLTFLYCTHEKYPTPSVPSEGTQTNFREARYVQINPPLDAAHGYDFNKPSDIYVGADNLIYVADTGNNRIIILDAGGTVQGISQPIPHPEAITQNDSLQLLIVNNSNTVFRIDLYKYDHEIENAPIEIVYQQSSEPDHKFTGISVHNKFEYYVTVLDVADSSQNTVVFSFIYDFFANNTLKGPLPLNRDPIYGNPINGTGLFSAIVPTAIVSLREQYLDISSQEITPAFIFCQSGKTSLIENNFKVQSVGTAIVEGSVILIPNTSLIGSDIYDVNKYYFPEDVAVDRSGFIFVVDKGRGITDPDTTKSPPGFYRFAPGGNQLQAILGAGSGNSQFKSPKGIAVLPFEENQIVYVADTGNNRILLFKLSTQL